MLLQCDIPDIIFGLQSTSQEEIVLLYFLPASLGYTRNFPFQSHVTKNIS